MDKIIFKRIYLFLKMQQEYHFITFGNQQYAATAERICNEAKNLNIFHYIKKFSEQELFSFPEFQQHKDFVYSNPRGFGYWLWKSFLTMKYMENMNEGDILVYADAGCTINEKGRKRMLEYFDMVNLHPSGILRFQLSLNNQTEEKWTKMDLIQHLNVEKYMEFFILVGGIFVLRKCDNSIQLVKKWYETAVENNYHFIDDSQSILSNNSSFIEHRHDQSIFSLLSRKYGSFIIDDEVEPPFKIDCPIWASRKV
jgi:hypothetical protein